MEKGEKKERKKKEERGNKGLIIHLIPSFLQLLLLTIITFI